MGKNLQSLDIGPFCRTTSRKCTNVNRRLSPVGFEAAPGLEGLACQTPGISLHDDLVKLDLSTTTLSYYSFIFISFCTIDLVSGDSRGVFGVSLRMCVFGLEEAYCTGYRSTVKETKQYLFIHPFFLIGKNLIYLGGGERQQAGRKSNPMLSLVTTVTELSANRNKMVSLFTQCL